MSDTILELDSEMSHSHIHYYERMFPLGKNSTINDSAIKDNNTFIADEGNSIIHVTTGQAGNIENLSQVKNVANFTAFLDTTHFGFTKMTVFNESTAAIQFVNGGNDEILDYCYFEKKQ